MEAGVVGKGGGEFVFLVKDFFFKLTKEMDENHSITILISHFFFSLSYMYDCKRSDTSVGSKHN